MMAITREISETDLSLIHLGLLASSLSVRTDVAQMSIIQIKPQREVMQQNQPI
ncbi:hypothetical protein HGG76_07935 [Ochrobactrum tritici]|uniref:Uncharacterized protein n=1 Tax=Brucella tritici TaxID=94626 RepID=A0A7X6FPS5_9HYPH|nr:hypothetical protein [Brucella tritici]